MLIYIMEKEIKRYYKSNGQHKEQKLRYNLTGKIQKADNIPFWVSGDCGSIQIKSARGPICSGTDIKEHLQKDAAQNYAYVMNDEKTVFFMSKAEYFNFACLFSEVTTESVKNGGGIKTRFRKESKAMVQWLYEQVK